MIMPCCKVDADEPHKPDCETGLAAAEWKTWTVAEMYNALCHITGYSPAAVRSAHQMVLKNRARQAEREFERLRDTPVTEVRL